MNLLITLLLVVTSSSSITFNSMSHENCLTSHVKGGRKIIYIQNKNIPYSPPPSPFPSNFHQLKPLKNDLYVLFKAKQTIIEGLNLYFPVLIWFSGYTMATFSCMAMLCPLNLFCSSTLLCPLSLFCSSTLVCPTNPISPTNLFSFESPFSL